MDTEPGQFSAVNVDVSLNAASESFWRSLRHARNAGAMLIEVREQLGHDRFGEWMDDNLTFSRRTAYRYIKIAREWSRILRELSSIDRDLTIRAAVKLLSEVYEEGKTES